MRFVVDVVRGREVPQVMHMQALSIADAQGQAARQGYTVLNVRPAGWGLPITLLRARGSSPLVLIEQLRDLLQAGLSVIEALTTLRESASTTYRPILEDLVARLRSGETLSAAMESDAQFSPLLVSLVRASEVTSNLQDALTRYLDHEQRIAEVRHRITSVSVYPLALVSVGFAVLFFLLLYVVPRFARVFEGMNGELPWSARAMMWWSHWLSGHWPIVVAAVLAIAVFVAAIILVPSTRSKVLSGLLAWEPLRVRLRLHVLSRWYRAIGMLVQGGIPLVQALELSSGILPIGFRSSGAAVERRLRDGQTPSQAFTQAGMATPIAEQLILAGERTGDLGEVLIRVATFHEVEVARALERGMRALEPIVMVCVGLGVGIVVVLMYMPIFELAAAVQ